MRPETCACSAEQLESMENKNTSLPIFGKQQKKGLHIKKNNSTATGLSLNSNMAAVYCFLEHPYSRLGVRVEMFYKAVKFVFVFRSRIRV